MSVEKSTIITVILYVIKTSFQRDVTDFSQKKTKLTVLFHTNHKCVTFITLGEVDCCLMGLLLEHISSQDGIINSVYLGPGYSELEWWGNEPTPHSNLIN